MHVSDGNMCLPNMKGKTGITQLEETDNVMTLINV